jgi:hypothetical protein
MKGLLFTLILLASAWSTAGQQATASPTPVELKLERLGTITAVTRTLRGVSSSEPKFESKEDHFRIQLPRETKSHKVAVWPKTPGEMPTPGRTTWDMVEAEIAVSITPMPPGLISTWSRDELSAAQTNSIDAGVSSASGKKIYEKEVAPAGLKGREARVEARGYIMFIRVFFANDRQNVIAAQLKRGGDSEALVKATFDTFEIVQ